MLIKMAFDCIRFFVSFLKNIIIKKTQSRLKWQFWRAKLSKSKLSWKFSTSNKKCSSKNFQWKQRYRRSKNWPTFRWLFTKRNKSWASLGQRLAKNQLIRNSWIIFPDSVSNHESRIAFFLNFDSNQRIKNQLFWHPVSKTLGRISTFR